MPTVLLLLATSVLALALWKVPEWQARSYRAGFNQTDVNALEPKDRVQLQKDLISAENNARATLAQIIGGGVLLFGLYFTWRTVTIGNENLKVGQDNLRVTEEGKLTERFSKAVELLGSENLDVRLGGIYALERIARDSQKDHWTVMEILTAFVRERSIAANPPEPAPHGLSQTDKPSDSQESTRQPEAYKVVTTDIQAALTVIGRRKWVDQETARQCLDFRIAALQRADLSGAKLRRANFRGADLTGADLTHVDLTEAILFGTDLSGANLTGAKLVQARLLLTTLDKTILEGADLESAEGLTMSQISVAAVDGSTKLPIKLLKE
jgi:hypothetical protein